MNKMPCPEVYIPELGEKSVVIRIRKLVMLKGRCPGPTRLNARYMGAAVMGLVFEETGITLKCSIHVNTTSDILKALANPSKIMFPI